LLIAAVAACSDDDNDTPAATTAPPAVTATVSPGASSTALPGSTTPPVDGTVDPLGFGSTDPFQIKSNPDPLSKTALLRNVRVGAHPEQGGWDRIVFEFQDVRPAGNISYVNSAVQCGSGNPVTLRGTAVLFVKFDATNAHNEAGQSTVNTLQIVGPGNSILESRLTCDFEADVSWAIGTSGRQRFKVTLLENPTRVVIDVKH
jgi:hypothetical protein